VEAVKFLWKRKPLKKEAGSALDLWLFEEPEAFFSKHGKGMQKLEVEAVKFLWKRKHFESKLGSD